MKTIINKILFIIFLTSASAAQTDSIMYLKETDFSLCKLHKVKYQSTGETVMEKEPMNIENVKTLAFLANDSLILAKNHKFAVRTKLSQIDEVTKYKRRFSPVLGATIGAIGGILLTGGFMWLVSSGVPKEGILLIIPVGGFIGAEITNLINHTTYDLSLVPDKDKKAKLIKFLKQK